VLAKLSLLEKALELFSEAEVPRGVLEEVERKRDEVYQELSRLISERKISVEETRKRLSRLGLGRSSAILLALMKDKIIVIDDRRARRLARELGLKVIGTLSILKELRREGVLIEAHSRLREKSSKRALASQLLQIILSLRGRIHRAISTIYQYGSKSVVSSHSSSNNYPLVPRLH